MVMVIFLTIPMNKIIQMPQSNTKNYHHIAPTKVVNILVPEQVIIEFLTSKLVQTEFFQRIIMMFKTNNKCVQTQVLQRIIIMFYIQVHQMLRLKTLIFMERKLG